MILLWGPAVVPGERVAIQFGSISGASRSLMPAGRSGASSPLSVCDMQRLDFGDRLFRRIGGVRGGQGQCRRRFPEQPH